VPTASSALLRGFATGALLALRVAGGGSVLALALAVDEGLLALGLGTGRLLLPGGLAVGLAQLLVGLRTLGVGDCLVRECGLAVAGLGLLELSLFDKVVLATHGAGHFLGLAREVVEEPFAGLGCFVVAHHLRCPLGEGPHTERV
jgi:hypothetical protein